MRRALPSILFLFISVVLGRPLQAEVAGEIRAYIDENPAHWGQVYLDFSVRSDATDRNADGAVRDVSFYGPTRPFGEEPPDIIAGELIQDIARVGSVRAEPGSRDPLAGFRCGRGFDFCPQDPETGVGYDPAEHQGFYEVKWCGNGSEDSMGQFIACSLNPEAAESIYVNPSLEAELQYFLVIRTNDGKVKVVPSELITPIPPPSGEDGSGQGGGTRGPVTLEIPEDSGEISNVKPEFSFDVKVENGTAIEITADGCSVMGDGRTTPSDAAHPIRISLTGGTWQRKVTCSIDSVLKYVLVKAEGLEGTFEQKIVEMEVGPFSWPDGGIELTCDSADRCTSDQPSTISLRYALWRQATLKTVTMPQTIQCPSRQPTETEAVGAFVGDFWGRFLPDGEGDAAEAINETTTLAEKKVVWAESLSIQDLWSGLNEENRPQGVAKEDPVILKDLRLDGSEDLSCFFEDGELKVDEDGKGVGCLLTGVERSLERHRYQLLVSDLPDACGRNREPYKSLPRLDLPFWTYLDVSGRVGQERASADYDQCLYDWKWNDPKSHWGEGYFDSTEIDNDGVWLYKGHRVSYGVAALNIHKAEVVCADNTVRGTEFFVDSDPRLVRDKFQDELDAIAGEENSDGEIKRAQLTFSKPVHWRESGISRACFASRGEDCDYDYHTFDCTFIVTDWDGKERAAGRLKSSCSGKEPRNSGLPTSGANKRVTWTISIGIGATIGGGGTLPTPPPNAPPGTTLCRRNPVAPSCS